MAYLDCISHPTDMHIFNTKYIFKCISNSEILMCIKLYFLNYLFYFTLQIINYNLLLSIIKSD